MADRVFDFSNSHTENTIASLDIEEYFLFKSESDVLDKANPLLILSNQKPMRHHECGFFHVVNESIVFQLMKEGGSANLHIVSMDARFEKLIQWLSENKTMLRLSIEGTERSYSVYKIRAIDSRLRSTEPTSLDGLLQMMISRILIGKIREEDLDDEDVEEDFAHFSLSDPKEMTDFLQVAGDTLPRKISLWARRNLALLSSADVSLDEKRHIKRALSMMLSISWQGSYFPPIDPVKAREILDEELYGLENVKQRIIETIIQINRTHTLPAYGILLVGPAGTGKSQIAYAVARILGLPWTALDMSAIHDAEALTGSPRIYANAKPGRIMEAFSESERSNIVFIINELDKAEGSGINGNPADALLTLLDNLGYTDNYVECVIPTSGVYPIATANDKAKISDPLMTRFALIELPDYSKEEKKLIFQNFALPRTLKRMGMEVSECIVTEDGVDAIVDKYSEMPGCRDLEQAAEHLCAHALYRIETEGVESYRFDGETVRKLLD